MRGESIKAHWPVLLWAALCAVLLLIPGDRLRPAVDAAEPLHWLEDPVHAVLAFGLCGLALRARPGPAPRRWRSGVAAASFAYLLALEFLQLLVPGRGWSVWDVAFSALGVLVARSVVRAPGAAKERPRI